MALDALTPAGLSALAVLALIYAVPRIVVALVAMYKVPPDKLAAVLRALAELFRPPSWFRRGPRA